MALPVQRWGETVAAERPSGSQITALVASARSVCGVAEGNVALPGAGEGVGVSSRREGGNNASKKLSLAKEKAAVALADRGP